MTHKSVFMRRTFHAGSEVVPLLLVTALLAGCGGTRVLKEPAVLTLDQPLASVADPQLEASLDWVIVRAGPGSWAKNADWDEYLLRIRNLGSEPVRIKGAAVYDSLGTRIESSANRRNLVKESRKTVRRYKGEGLRVKAGLAGPYLIAAGGAAYVAAEALALSALTASSGYGAAGASFGALTLVPVLVVGGVVRSVNNDKVSREIINRQSALPVDIQPVEQENLVFFFALAPSPIRLEITYEDSAGEHLLTVDTREPLQGLHIGDAGRQTPTSAGR